MEQSSQQPVFVLRHGFSVSGSDVTVLTLDSQLKKANTDKTNITTEFSVHWSSNYRKPPGIKYFRGAFGPKCARRGFEQGQDYGKPAEPANPPWFRVIGLFPWLYRV